jgi:hypothetical protein
MDKTRETAVDTDSVQAREPIGLDTHDERQQYSGISTRKIHETI